MSIAYKHDQAIKVFFTFGKINGYFYPHFIVKYKGMSAKIAIDRTIIEGLLPSDIIHLVLDWVKKNYLDLESKWNQMMNCELSYRSAA